MVTGQNIAVRIDELIGRKKWTKYKLAKEARIAQKTLYNIFEKDSIPQITTVSQICEALDISLSEFFDLAGSYRDSHLTEEERQFIEGYRSFDERQKGRMLGYFYALMEEIDKD